MPYAKQLTIVHVSVLETEAYAGLYGSHVGLSYLCTNKTGRPSLTPKSFLGFLLWLYAFFTLLNSRADNALRSLGGPSYTRPLHTSSRYQKPGHCNAQERKSCMAKMSAKEDIYQCIAPRLDEEKHVVDETERVFTAHDAPTSDGAPRPGNPHALEVSVYRSSRYLICLV